MNFLKEVVFYSICRFVLFPYYCGAIYLDGTFAYF